jgi:hypothetical protein
MDIMASPPDPEDLKTIGGIAGAVVGAFWWFIWYIRRSAGSNALDPTAMALLKEMRKDIDRVETLVKEAVNHAETSHKEMGVEINGLKTCLAVVKNEVTHLRSGRK